MKIDDSIIGDWGDEVIAFTSIRETLDAADPYSGGNICTYSGDDKSHTLANTEDLADMMRIPSYRIIQPGQTHTNNVAIIHDNDVKEAVASNPSFLKNIDAVVTDATHLVIGINTADCVPIIFYDPIRRIAAAAHAGWRGTASNICRNTVKAMISLGAAVGDIFVGIGAAICIDCYEVGNEVVDAIAGTGIDMNNVVMTNIATGKPHIDLRQANKLLLMQCGIIAENIKINYECTYCNQAYYSARRQGIKSGRNYTAIMMA